MDMEKVIKGLETCNKYGYECPECPYHDPEDTEGCHAEELMADAIALLKEQEAIIEILVKDITFHNCNNCNRKDCKSKPNAGQPVRSNCIHWLEGR